jgi:hypothetical protein
VRTLNRLLQVRALGVGRVGAAANKVIWTSAGRGCAGLQDDG